MSIKEQRKKVGKEEGGREGRRELSDQFEETGGLPFS